MTIMRIETRQDYDIEEHRQVVRLDITSLVSGTPSKRCMVIKGNPGELTFQPKVVADALRKLADDIEQSA